MTDLKRTVLLSTASAAAMAIMPATAAAQTLCSLDVAGVLTCGTPPVAQGTITGSATYTDNAGLLISGNDVEATIASVNGGSIEVATGPAITLDNLGSGNATLDAAGLDILATNGPAFLASATGGTTAGITATLGNVTVVDGGAGIDVSATGSADVTSADIVTGGDDAAGAVFSATPVVRFTAGDIVTTGDRSPGVLVTGAQDVEITTGTVTTSGADSAGISVDVTGGPVTLSYGSIATTGTGDSGALLVTGADTDIVLDGAGATLSTAGDGVTAVSIDGGSVTGNLGNVVTTGAGSAGVVIAATGDVDLDVGTVTATGPGVDIATAGGGSLSLGTGAVATSEDGATAVALTADGPVSFTGTTTTTTGANAPAIDIATTGTGAVTVTTGVVSATGAGSDAVRIAAAGNAPVQVTVNGNVTSADGAGVSASSAGTVAVTVGSGVTVQGATTGIVLDGAAGNTLTINGTVRSSLAGNPAWTVTGGPLTLNLGTGGTFAGTAAFTDGNDVLNNTGSLALGTGLTFGAGDDTLNNAGTATLTGTVDFGAGVDAFVNTGTVVAVGGTAAVANLETFTNRGLIDLRDGAANDTLTISGNFVGGTGSRLGLDVNGNTADRLVVGGAASGSTAIELAVLNPLVNTTGIVVVDTGAATVPAGAFTLAGQTGQGLIDYSLVTTGGDVRLVSQANVAAADALLLNRVGRDFWYNSADVYGSYAAARRVDFGSDRTGRPVGLWGQLYYHRDRYGDEDRAVALFGTPVTADQRTRTGVRGVQGGIDFGLANFVVGVTGGYQHVTAGSAYGNAMHGEGYNYGAYAQFGMANGIYGGVLVKRDEFDLDVSNAGRGISAFDIGGRSTGIEGEIGFRFGGFGSINLDASAGFAHVRTRIDDYSYGFLDFDTDTFTSQRGRLGVRASFAGAIAPFVDAKVFHEFKNDNAVLIGSGALGSELVDAKRGTWGRFEAGVGGGARYGFMLSGWVEVGDSKGWGVRGGFRF